MFPAFPHIWAARALAHRVQVQRAHDALQFLVVRPSKILHTQPGRAGVGRGRRSSAVRQYGERSRHLGQVQSNSTLGSLAKQPRARGLTRPYCRSRPSSIPNAPIIRRFAFSEGKAAHPTSCSPFRRGTCDSRWLLYIYNTGKSSPTESSVTH